MIRQFFFLGGGVEEGGEKCEIQQMGKGGKEILLDLRHELFAAT